jgi:hypothetical protein
MAVLKFGFTAQPAVARAAVVRAASGVAASSSENTFKSHVWFESAFVFVTQNFSRQLANVLVALLTPAALVALVLGIWRVCTDLGWARAFFIAGGFFSHWQVWIALSIGLKMLSSTLIAWGARTSKFSEEN